MIVLNGASELVGAVSVDDTPGTAGGLILGTVTVEVAGSTLCLQKGGKS